MTVRGFVFVIVEVLLFFLSFGTADREIFICFICVTLLGLFSFLSVLYNALFLNVSASLSRHQATRGDAVDFTVFLTGISLFPSTVGVDIKIPGEEKFLSCAFHVVPGFGKKTHTCNIPCLHRGEWNITVKKLRVYDLFGFFRFSLAHTTLRRNSFALPISVTPRAHNIDKKPRVHFAQKGIEFSSYKAAEDGDAFGDTRLYRHGDTMRRIHWVQTMRARKIYVRRYEQQKDQSVLILLDCSYVKNAVKTADVATEIALSMLACYEKNGIPARLICINDNIAENSGYNIQIDSKAGIQSAFGVLTKVKFIKQRHCLSLFNIGIGRKYHVSTVQIISPKTDAPLIAEVGQLNAKGIHTNILVPANAKGENTAVCTHVPECADIVKKVGGLI